RAGRGRWTTRATATSPGALAVVGPLPGFTFALLPLACMRWIGAFVPPHLGATAQSIYAVGATAMTASMTIVSGPLYADFGAHGFLLMALLCAVALPLTRGLRAATVDRAGMTDGK